MGVSLATIHFVYFDTLFVVVDVVVLVSKTASPSGRSPWASHLFIRNDLSYDNFSQVLPPLWKPLLARLGPALEEFMPNLFVFAPSMSCPWPIVGSISLATNALFGLIRLLKLAVFIFRSITGDCAGDRGAEFDRFSVRGWQSSDISFHFIDEKQFADLWIGNESTVLHHTKIRLRAANECFWRRTVSFDWVVISPRASLSCSRSCIQILFSLVYPDLAKHLS